MNLNSLIKEIYSLGFEAEGGQTTAMLPAITRSLNQIFTDYPSERAIRLLPNVPRPKRLFNTYSHTPTEDDEFDISGVAFSFKVSGEGEATVKDENGERCYKFNTPYGVVRDFLSGSGKIIFSGAYSYTVSDLAAFDGVVSSERDKIPVADDFLSISMRELAPDFFFFTRLPMRADGSPVKEARLEGDRLLIPTSYEGELTIVYNRQPTAPDIDRPDEELDVPSCCAHLLPLLAASFVWLEDDTERAAYYMSLYRDGIARIANAARASVGAEFTDVTGWA